MLGKITPILFLTLCFSLTANASDDYRKALNDCYQEFNKQVDAISPPLQITYEPLKPEDDKTLVRDCANALRGSARTAKGLVEQAMRNYRNFDLSAGEKNFDCNLRRIFQNDLSKSLQAAQNRELDVLVAATASTSKQFGPDPRRAFFRHHFSKSTAKRLELNPSLIMPASKNEKQFEKRVHASIRLCSNNESAAMKNPATRSQSKELFQLQSIYDVGNVHDKTKGFERCIRDKLLPPLAAKTDLLQATHDKLAERNAGVGCVDENSPLP